jgi:hypothetical protein
MMDLQRARLRLFSVKSLSSKKLEEIIAASLPLAALTS